LKCSAGSEGLVRIILLCCDDILEDKSTNDLKTSLELIRDQLEMIGQMEGYA